MTVSRPVKKSARIVNGYVLVYEPSHPKAMKSCNWDGYIYEQIKVAENNLGRPIRDSEIVHHLDGNRQNNRQDNLLIIERSQHTKLEQWLAAGAPSMKIEEWKRKNSGEPELVQPLHCLICGTTLQAKQYNYCSPQCSRIGTRKVERPTKEVLAEDLKKLSILAIGRKYGVSDNAVRKWARQYGLIERAILSRAEGGPSEGAETTGEVDPLNNRNKPPPS